MKHTPGPWGIKQPSKKNELEITYSFFKNGEEQYGQNIAKVYGPGSGATELSMIFNARIIAAAPEMLEALKLIIGKAEAGKLSNELGKHVKLENIIADCQAIIAKAEGR